MDIHNRLTTMPKQKKKYELIVFGATSFVGQILCRYLVAQFGNKLSWAAAGRSKSKLKILRASLGEEARGLPLLIADAADQDAMLGLCDQARVIVSTVGPYALHGEPLVKACAETGTDYCDLTGEPHWIRRMIDRYESTARATGARIVHCCGFDSLPSDLGVYFLQQVALKEYGITCKTVRMRVKALVGGASGGTAASVINLITEAANDKALRRELKDPYSICPPGHGFRKRQENLTTARFDTEFDSWIMPFVMSAINTRVVHRSNALLNGVYGKEFSYDEASMTRKGAKGWMTAQSVAIGTAGFMAAVAVPPLRDLIARHVAPQPGEGPSPAAQERGYFDFRFRGSTGDGNVINVKVTGDRDPGYGSTGKMLGQAAVCLARDISKSSCAGGFWTPATIFGDKLIKRLVADAGLTFSVL